MRIPLILDRVAAAGHTVFYAAASANLVAMRGPGKPGEWDGALYLAYRATLQSGWTEFAWPCATRPGLKYLHSPINPSGTLVLEPGQYRLSHRKGLHHGRPALVQVRPMTGRRDSDRDDVLDPPSTLYTGLFAANIHDVTTPDDLAGCIGLQRLHLLELITATDRLVPSQGEDFTLTLVEG